MSTAADDILRQLPVSQLAQQLGRSPEEVEQAVREAVPSMIGGLERNASDSDQEASIARALSQHASSPLAGDGEVDLGQVDAQDGAKIVRHIFGEDADQTARALGAKGGADQDLLRQLLPIIAPIVLAYLARRLGSSQGAGGKGSILGDLLESVAGGAGGLGGSAPRTGGAGGGILGSILGQILRGGR